MIRLVDSTDKIDVRLRASFDELAPDRYLRDGPCFRHRAYGRADVAGIELRWREHAPFVQSEAINGYAGGIAREFAPLPEAGRRFAERLVGDPDVRRTIDADRLEIGCHQIRVVAEDSVPGHPTPEGLHQDGFDFVSITCVARHNVSGAVTIVSPVSGAQAPVLDRALEPGETVLLDDRRLRHYASPIRPRQPGWAHRDVIVLTFSRSA